MTKEERIAYRTRDGSIVANAMLRELMAAMGESDHARSQTPESVWYEMLHRVRAAFSAVPPREPAPRAYPVMPLAVLVARYGTREP